MAQPNLLVTQTAHSRETFDMSEPQEVAVKDNRKRRCIIIALLLLLLAILATLIIVLSVVLTRSKPDTINESNTTALPTSSTTMTSTGSNSPWTDASVNGTTMTTQILSATNTTTETTTFTSFTSTTTIVSTIATISSTSVPSFNPVINGDFETADTRGWILGGGSRNNIASSTIRAQDYLPGGVRYNSTIANTHSRIVNRNIDPLLITSMPVTVHNGNYALRIEDTFVGSDISVATQTVNNYRFSNIYFAWLAVAHNSGHPADDHNFLVIEVKDTTDNVILLHRSYNDGIDFSSDIARFRDNGTYFYTPSWHIENVSINSTRLGHSFSLTIIAADCYGGAHLSYIYIDDFGPTPP